MKFLVIFLALCTLAAAMVPKERRSEVPTKEKCNSRTPCRWGVFKENTKIIDTYIDNAFCDCPANKTCEESELDDNSYIYRCRPKSESGDGR